MPITASDLYDYVQCPHRVTMNVVGDPAERDPVSPFVEFLWERGNAYEREVIARLGQVANALADAEIVAVDWEPVLAVARANAERAGIIKRYRTVAGSAFDVDWGKSYDLAPLPNFLHHFDYATCVGLLKKVRQSLASNGKTLAVEFVPNEDRISPHVPATFAFHMLAFTPPR